MIAVSNRRRFSFKGFWVGLENFTRVARLSDLPHGTRQVIDIAGKKVLICNLNGKIFAISNICSHAEETLDCGRISNGWIACPIHGARFDLATGKAKNPPAKQPIPVYQVRVEDDWIEIAA
ncbi:non-heme iron oxygenase ferredoxin subunit [Acidocella sp.]|uniref:Rieske (2Fe-2S) protein n=1 Tax=Acidocella sp. TaxID=50710 RepID=UPI002610F631|nr:non-heme iron oxygenase ferredoxin subunit [Acidocella sp.]